MIPHNGTGTYVVKKYNKSVVYNGKKVVVDL